MNELHFFIETLLYILYKYPVLAIFFAFIMFAYCIAISFRYYRSVNRDKVTDS